MANDQIKPFLYKIHLQVKCISVVTKVAPKQHNHKFSLFRTYWLVCAVLFQVFNITIHYHHYRFDPGFFFITNAFDTSVISIIIISTTNISIIIISTTNITVAVTITMNDSQASVSVDCPRGLTSRCQNFSLNVMIDDYIPEVLFFLFNRFFVCTPFDPRPNARSCSHEVNY